MDASELYHTDFVLWTEQQAAALRRLGSGSNSLDIEHLAEEVEDLGKRDVREVESYVRQMMLHGLKAASDPTSLDVPHWRAEILTFQQNATAAFAPSMLRSIDADRAWRSALSILSANLAKPSRSSLLGAAGIAGSPVTIAQLVDPGFDLDGFIGQCSSWVADHMGQAITSS